MSDVVFVGFDWGTSSVRAYSFERNGQVQASACDSPARPLGVQTLHQHLGRTPLHADFALGLNALLAELSAPKGVPMLACGMIGSKQGLVDAGYLACPTSPTVLAKHLVRTHLAGYPLSIVPGLNMQAPARHLGAGFQQASAPDFMRGEETQVLGALDTASLQRDGLMILPGSHSKWVQVQGADIVRFETHFSGELFSAVKDNSILGRLFSAPAVSSEDTDSNIKAAFSSEAFMQGIALAKQAPDRLQAHLFSVRAMGLDGSLSPQAGPDFLSGLLIGHELAVGLASFPEAAKIQIIGNPQLCERYTLGLSAFDRTASSLGNTSAAGLWRLAKEAGLVASPVL
jgi:2-dehydro-3-deoxygalactonokinase